MLPNIFQGDYDALSLYQLATLCRLHYKADPGTNYRTIQVGTGRRHTRRYFGEAGTLTPLTVVIDYADYRTVIVQGTVGAADWYNNIASIESENLTPAGHQAAAGWMTSALALYGLIFPAEATDNEKPVLFCGHSAGGAIATLMAYRHAGEHPNGTTAVVSFGAPKCLNAGALSRLEERPYFRVVRQLDYVESLPPFGAIFQLTGLPVSNLGNTFMHGGSLILLPHGGGAPQRYEGEFRPQRTIALSVLHGNPERGLSRAAAQAMLAPTLQTVEAVTAAHLIKEYCGDLRRHVVNGARGPLGAFDSVNLDLVSFDGEVGGGGLAVWSGFETYTTVLNEDLYFPTPLTAPVVLPELLPPPAPDAPVASPPAQQLQRAFRRRRNAG